MIEGQMVLFVIIELGVIQLAVVFKGWFENYCWDMEPLQTTFSFELKMVEEQMAPHRALVITERAQVNLLV